MTDTTLAGDDTSKYENHGAPPKAMRCRAPVVYVTLSVSSVGSKRGVAVEGYYRNFWLHV